MTNKTLYTTLAICTILAFLFTLVLSTMIDGNPFARLGHSLLTSLLPALGALVVIKLTLVVGSWRGVTLIYALFLALTVTIQGVVR